MSRARLQLGPFTSLARFQDDKPTKGSWLPCLAALIGIGIKPQATNHKPHLLTLAAVGDIMLDRYVGRAIDRNGANYPLGKVRGALRQSDLVIANLECPLTSHPKELIKHFPFRVPPDRVGALRGIDIVSVANNHTLDCGSDGLVETLRTLDKAGIQPLGAGLDPWKPVIVSKNGLRIAFFALSDFPEREPISPRTPGSAKSGPPPAPGEVWGGNAQPDVAFPKTSTPQRLAASPVAYYNASKMKAAILAAGKDADVIVVFAHWGVEGDSSPSDRQRREAKELAADGADLILGAHPHVLQPVEHIGKTVVAYSLGDFVFDTTKPKEAKTAIFRFTLTKKGVESFELVPCRIRHARPEPGSSNAKRHLQHSNTPILHPHLPAAPAPSTLGSTAPNRNPVFGSIMIA
ncbi:MAG: CapA family protein [Fimbriimonadales bacterium]